MTRGDRVSLQLIRHFLVATTLRVCKFCGSKTIAVVQPQRKERGPLGLPSVEQRSLTRGIFVSHAPCEAHEADVQMLGQPNGFRTFSIPDPAFNTALLIPLKQ